MLGMANPDSARTNVVRHLERVGLIDGNGALTERGQKWRVDATYPEACQDILDDIYPDELAGLSDTAGKPDRSRLGTWFEHKGFGGSNATQMAATYAMIAEKTIPEPPGSDDQRPAAKKVAKQATRKQPAARANRSEDSRAQGREDDNSGHGGTDKRRPDIHLDIQIHIPADASPDQIDQIFASMAKHLYGR